jgi:hypothetical protein
MAAAAAVCTFFNDAFRHLQIYDCNQILAAVKTCQSKLQNIGEA